MRPSENVIRHGATSESRRSSKRKPNEEIRNKDNNNYYDGNNNEPPNYKPPFKPDLLPPLVTRTVYEPNFEHPDKFVNRHHIDGAYDTLNYNNYANYDPGTDPNNTYNQLGSGPTLHGPPLSGYQGNTP